MEILPGDDCYYGPEEKANRHAEANITDAYYKREFYPVILEEEEVLHSFVVKGTN